MTPHLFLEDLVMTTYNVMRPLKTFARMLTFTAGLAFLPTIYSACDSAEEKKPTVAGCYFDSDCWEGRVCVSTNDQPLSSANPGKCAYGSEEAGDEYDDPLPPAPDVNPVDAGIPPQPECTDEDNDHFYRQEGCGTAVDCDDKNQTMFPGAQELCNLVDDDCNIEVDNGFQNGPCYSGQGSCRREGTYTCSDTGLEATCNAVAGEPGEVICDSSDNDCDGVVDTVENCGLLALAVEGGIFLSYLDGNGLSRIGGVQGSNYSPSWSPDGTRIAFRSRSGDINSLNIISVDGGAIQRIVGGIADYEKPVWSPDGQKIFFVGSGAKRDIYSVNIDGSNLIGLTNDDDAEKNISLSPDERFLAFEREGRGGLYILNLETREVTNPVMGHNSDWSPDGTKIVYHASGEGGWKDIFITDPQGINVQNLTNNPREHDSNPKWSPKGTEIAFFRGRGGFNRIYIMRADGGGISAVTQSPDLNNYVEWSPDGHFLAFKMHVGNVYTLNLITLALTNITRDDDQFSFAGFSVSPQYRGRIQ